MSIASRRGMMRTTPPRAKYVMGVVAAAVALATFEAGCSSGASRESVGTTRGKIALAEENPVDESSPDASSSDPSSPDASSPDPSSPDASSPDASSPDASSPDPSSPDASPPPPPDASRPPPPQCDPAAVQTYPHETTCCGYRVDDAGTPAWGACMVTYSGDPQGDGGDGYTVSFNCVTPPAYPPVDGVIDNGSGNAGSSCSAPPELAICECYGCNTSQ